MTVHYIPRNMSPASRQRPSSRAAPRGPSARRWGRARGAHGAPRRTRSRAPTTSRSPRLGGAGEGCPGCPGAPVWALSIFVHILDRCAPSPDRIYTRTSNMYVTNINSFIHCEMEIFSSLASFEIARGRDNKTRRHARARWARSLPSGAGAATHVLLLALLAVWRAAAEHCNHQHVDYAPRFPPVAHVARATPFFSRSTPCGR